MESVIKKTSDIVEDLIRAIESAEKEILLQTFYFDNDAVGRRLLQALTHKASHGVKVYCLLDALGSRGLSDSREEKEAVAGGVHIEYFNWLTPWSFRNKRSWFFRNHKRALIIDNSRVYLGGWCIGNKTLSWMDSVVCITNEHVVKRAVGDFKNMYQYARKPTISFHHEKKFAYSLDPEHTHQYAYQAPLLRARHIYYTYLKLIRSAVKKLALVAPYFVPDRRLIREILQAKQRGVEVAIYIPENTDYKTVDIAGRTFFTKLLQKHINIYLYPTMLHAKLSVIDDTVFIGSLNLDNISLRYNFENGVFVRDEGLLVRVYEDIKNIETDARPVRYDEWTRRSLWDKMLEKVVGVFKGLL